MAWRVQPPIPGNTLGTKQGPLGQREILPTGSGGAVPDVTHTMHVVEGPTGARSDLSRTRLEPLSNQMWIFYPRGFFDHTARMRAAVIGVTGYRDGLPDNVGRDKFSLPDSRRSRLMEEQIWRSATA